MAHQDLSDLMLEYMSKLLEFHGSKALEALLSMDSIMHSAWMTYNHAMVRRT
jgi:hypothetical protein